MDADFPPFAMVDLYFGDRNAALTIMSRGKRFHVFFIAEDLCGPQGDETLVQTFLGFKNSMDDDPYAMEALEEWMLKPCVLYMNQLAPPIPRVEPPSLAEYFNPETFFLKLANREGRLEAIRCPDDPSVTHSLTPRVSMSDPTVSEAISKGVPCIPALQLVAILKPDAYEADYDLIPNTVRAIGRDTQFHFKGAFEQHSFRRELDTLLRFRGDSFFDDLPVSRLGGLVTWDDGRSIMGLLVEYIHGSETLGCAAEDASKAEREKWAQQIRATVKKLHDANITWGDVKPDNILIDADGDAWVIDFGGGCAEGWVDRDLEGTKEGDLQGLSSLENFLGIKAIGHEAPET
ncbi:hypothetical protein K505DRAFT_417050 [Melanomma pulvis-pyrius CBS 109.77]|uniref:Protein kinase domain-containing protein n=1 Tax=Melanomma pulvis-pyrius CBS 109.77 TaxID=1314802 RepID=A0A6A6XD86_9PLEO|nr:hypothetical protein K505DRAFT_417050 [Melanomma pulvis-pyrius CBS 109.77]